MIKQNPFTAGLFLLILGASGVSGEPTAQSPKVSDWLNRDSPQSTVISFLNFDRAKNYDRAARYLDLSHLAQNRRLAEGPRLAAQLGQILERDAQFDPAKLSAAPEGDQNGSLPSNRERVAAYNTDGKQVELDLERAELRPGLAVWRFSADSVQRIPALARTINQTPFERHLPVFLSDIQFLDTSLWRWTALLLLAGALALLSRMLSRIVFLGLRQIVNIGPHIGWQRLLETFLGPVQLLVGVALFRGGMEWVQPAPRLLLLLIRGLAALSIFGIAWLCARAADLISGRLRQALEISHPLFSRSVLPMASRIFKIGILTFALTAVLGSWGFNTTTFLTGLGIGGIAVALAAQKTIENLFGGVAIVSDRPVFVGDFCKFGDSVGTVEDIGLRSTRIRTVDRTLLTIPNGQLSSMTLENFSQRDKMLFHQKLNLNRDTSPEQVRALLDAFHRILKQHPRTETGGRPVRFIGVGATSLDIEVFAYILTNDGDEFLKIQQELLLGILDAVGEAGASLAQSAQPTLAYSK